MALSLLPATALASEPQDNGTWAEAVTGQSAGYTVDDDGNVDISAAEGLAWLAKQVDAGNDFSGKTVTLTDNIDLSGREWIPIGTSEHQFSGIFDGGQNTISNLTVNRPAQSDVGLFGFTSGGEVKNFTLRNAKITGYLDVGAVAGTPYTSKYTDISITGLIQVDGYAYVGGALGKNAYADITNVDVTGDPDSYVKAESRTTVPMWAALWVLWGKAVM